MANDYTKILGLANKNNMGLSNTIKRDYGIPLDYSSVQENYEAALAYAQTSTLAYIGQPISVGDTLYIVTDEANGYLKAVGTKSEGDEQSITISDNGKISIKGFEAAADATLPQKQADGSLRWVPVTNIVEGDGNTKTVLTAADGSDITVTPSYDEANDTYTYTLDVSLPAVTNYSVTKEIGEGKVTYTLVNENNETIGESIIVPNAYDDSALATRVTNAETTIGNHEDRITEVKNKVDAFFGAIENPDEVIDTLAEIQSYITEDKTGAASMAASIKANTDALAVLNGEGTGSVKKTVEDAITAQAAVNAGIYVTQEALSEATKTFAKTTDVEAALNGKVDVEALNTALEGYYTKGETYSKDDIDRIVDGIQGAYGETADSVAADLAIHIQATSDRFADIEAKNANQDVTITNINNAISSINNTQTGILASAKSYADEVVTKLENEKVSENTAAIDAVNEKVINLNTSLNDIVGVITNLEATDSALEESINENKTAIASNAQDYAKLDKAVTEHDTAIAALETKDSELAAAVENLASNFDDYYTAEEVDNKIAATGYEAIASALEANTAAIEAEVTRATDKELALEEAVNANAEAISENATEIARIDNVLAAALENNGEGLDSIKELATWITQHESNVIPAINANTEAISTLNGDGEGSVAKTVEDAISSIPHATALKAGLVKASEEVTVTSDGVMQIGAISTDKLIQGTNTLVLNGGNATTQDYSDII